MQFSNRFIGIVAVVGAVAIVYGTFGFRAVPGQQFGSAFFPHITAACLALTGLAMILGPSTRPWFTLPDWMRSRRGLRAAALLAGGIAWVLLGPSLGFILTTFLLILALILLAGGRVLIGLGVAVGLTLLLHVIFGVLLRIPLPFGVVEGWLI
ncbi:tripartite tricarboxylate transporter TctB family protein [Pelagibius litoralis]|uniref:Tripartite tricarboxylate transporter TctB family protein n=1 Tax=Pelagibius litoralis TaxID=374515 RepID=A0A967KES5_9PROT|nr:tripartite tricarboxylate transporter TctB family protein [Pelagibius litoralis]NIA72074.1 tripartite tricarboxylate transporter TctB family protein [Pelagibius litoralis]